MKNNQSGASNKLVIAILVTIAAVFIISLLYYQYWYVPNHENREEIKQIKTTDFSWTKYKDKENGFEFFYPKNKITFKNKEAVFYVYIADKKELRKISTSANIPFFVSVESFTPPQGAYTVYINPLELSVSVLEKPKEYFGLDYFIDDQKSACIKENEKTGIQCGTEKVNVDGQDAFKLIKLEVLPNDAVKPLKEYLFITRSGINYILRLEYDYLDKKLEGSGQGDDTTLRKQIIQEIISKGFTLN